MAQQIATVKDLWFSGNLNIVCRHSIGQSGRGIYPYSTTQTQKTTDVCLRPSGIRTHDPTHLEQRGHCDRRISPSCYEYFLARSYQGFRVFWVSKWRAYLLVWPIRQVLANVSFGSHAYFTGSGMLLPTRRQDIVLTAVKALVTVYDTTEFQPV
jgi:hypothetical protein